MTRENRLKILSLLSSLCLWFYVIAVINPDSVSKLEGLPVNISNTVELAENNLVLLPESKPTIDVILEGKISDLRKLKKENIRVSMEISNPSEGKNEAVLSVSGPNNINYKLKESTAIVQLEKTIYKNFEISSELPKDKNTSDYYLNLSVNNVKVNGPRTSIKKIDKVVAVIKDDSFELNKDIGVQLKAIDLKGNEVENAVLESSIIQVNIKKIEHKELKVKAIFNEPINIETVIINPISVTVSGSSDILATLTEISTKPIDVKSLIENGFVLAELDILEGLEILTSTNSDKSEELKNAVMINIIN